ncbi:MAG TPA: hypothetical protein VN441_17050, partial [Syntrophomonas sp.]|nr:hypothetical protein [Syntrophomonas sp.]
VNVYSFKVNEGEFVPYSTSSPTTLLSNILKGNVVYINGQYYATPDYVKLRANTQVFYSGDDLNRAIYPRPDRTSLHTLEWREIFFLTWGFISVRGVSEMSSK